MATRKARRKPARHARKRASRAKRPAQRPRTLRQFRAMNAEQQERWIQATNTIKKMRAEGVSLNRAARASGTDAQTVKKLVPFALRRDRHGRWVATKRDSLLRVLTIPGQHGQKLVVVKDSRTASQLGRFADAAGKFIRRGDPAPLKTFRKSVLKDASGKRIPLVTDLQRLNELGHAGVLSFESLYARSAS